MIGRLCVENFGSGLCVEEEGENGFSAAVRIRFWGDCAASTECGLRKMGLLGVEGQGR